MKKFRSHFVPICFLKASSMKEISQSEICPWQCVAAALKIFSLNWQICLNWLHKELGTREHWRRPTGHKQVVGLTTIAGSPMGWVPLAPNLPANYAPFKGFLLLWVVEGTKVVAFFECRLLQQHRHLVTHFLCDKTVIKFSAMCSITKVNWIECILFAQGTAFHLSPTAICPNVLSRFFQKDCVFLFHNISDFSDCAIILKAPTLGEALAAL